MGVIHLMRGILTALTLLALPYCYVEGTPSSVFWTVCTTDVYETGTGHLDVDNYFRLFNGRGRVPALLPDIGFGIGAFSWRDLSLEMGVDMIGGTHHPLFFNAGIAVSENKLFSQAPSLKVGIFNAGTQYKRYRTNQNIVDLIIGKSLPDWIGGRFCIGAFAANRAIGRVREGFMVSYQRPFSEAKHCDGKEYFKWIICADYASGKNTIGGGGFGVYYYFTPNISILTGPVWFNWRKMNGKWKWSVQIDISFSVFDPKKMPKLS